MNRGVPRPYNKLRATWRSATNHAGHRMGQLDQATRPAALKTPLGENVLVLKSFSGSEGLGEPFEFHIEALSEQENVDFD